VNLVDYPDANIVQALLEGDVDAVVTWAPHALVLINELGNNASVFSDRDLYSMTWNIVGIRDHIERDPGMSAAFLRAIVRSETFIKEHKQRAYQITSEYLGTDSLIYEGVWDDYSFATSLDEGLILMMEEQARWMVEEGLTQGQDLPNFQMHVYTSALRSVKPEAVTIPGK
jgi:NitT/TauT family transport system substrate-binding protein